MLSVIIPIYKVEATLNRCVESVAGQTFGDLEILLVNDGSPDGCPAICERWAKKDRRITVINKTNGGLSSARNAGLDMAHGEYVTFVDSDDFVDKSTYASVIRRFSDDIDIVEYPVFRFYGSARQSLLTFGEKTFRDGDEYWLEGKAYAHSYACNKVYRRSVFGGVRFPDGHVFEDTYTLPRILENSRSIATINEGLYYYCDNPRGITNTADGYALSELLYAHVSRFCPITDETYYSHVLNIQLDVSSLTGLAPTLNTLRVRHPWRQGFRNGMKLSLLNVIGIKNLCKLYRLLHKLKTME